jgi:ribonuclease HI
VKDLSKYYKILARVGHLRYWEEKIKKYNIAVNETDSDQLVKSRTWEKNFEVLDFETTRDDALDHWGTWTCYTDGSKLGNHSGYGYICNKYGRTIYEGFDYMGPKATVFMAEIRAITTVAYTLMQRKKQKIIIRCDSQAAIQAINNININSKTVLECRKLLNQLGARNSLKICWIKAHASHAGNEMADRLAKMGANQTIGPARFKYYEASVSTNQSLIARCNQNWQARWDEDPTKYLQSKCFIQTVSNNTSKFNSMLRNSNRQEIGRLVQYITGHCTLNYHANKQNSLLDPQCRRCGSAPETPIHFTRSCESLTESRINLFEGIDILNDGFNWSCGQLLEFLTKSGIWAQLDYLAV